MQKETKTIFLENTLKQIPVYYRFLTEFETNELGELKVGARFSTCNSHFSLAYLNFPHYKPVSNVELKYFFQKEMNSDEK